MATGASAAGGSMSLASNDNETLHDWKDVSTGKVIQVPKDILEALEAPLRGQSNFGKQHTFLLSLFHDVPEYHQNLRPNAH